MTLPRLTFWQQLSDEWAVLVGSAVLVVGLAVAAWFGADGARRRDSSLRPERLIESARLPSMVEYHVAQYNIARMRAELDDPMMQGFVSRLDELNHLGDRSPGFVWRLHTDDDTSTSIRLYEDERIIINMTVWESIDALHGYAYRSEHGPVYAARHTWFAPMDGHTLVLWWIPAGQEPRAQEGKERLELLRRAGPTAEAFTMKVRFPPPG